MAMLIKPGTKGSLVMRVILAIFSVVGSSVMQAVAEYNNLMDFRFFIVALYVHCGWSLILAAADIYVLRKGNITVSPSGTAAWIVVIGDGLMLFVVFVVSSGTLFFLYSIHFDLHLCHKNPCNSFLISGIVGLGVAAILMYSYYSNHRELVIARHSAVAEANVGHEIFHDAL